MKVDWSNVQAVYVTSEARPTLRALAEKFGVSVRQICRHSKADNWKSLRDKFWASSAPDVIPPTEDELSDPVSLLENILKKLYAQFNTAPVSDAGNIVREIRGLIKLLDTLKPEKKLPEVPRDDEYEAEHFRYLLETKYPELAETFGNIMWNSFKAGKIKYISGKRSLCPEKVEEFVDFYSWLEDHPDRRSQFDNTCLVKNFVESLEKIHAEKNVTSQKKIAPPPGRGGG